MAHKQVKDMNMIGPQGKLREDIRDTVKHMKFSTDGM